MTVEVQIANALMDHVTRFGQWVLRSASWSNNGFWFRDIEDNIRLYQAPFKIAFPDVRFDKPDDEIYLEVLHFRNTNGSPDWGTDENHLGILQVNVVSPERIGQGPCLEIAGSVKDFFKKNTSLFFDDNRLKIYQNPTVLSMVQEGSKSIYPVSIPYRSYIQGN